MAAVHELATLCQALFERLDGVKRNSCTMLLNRNILQRLMHKYAWLTRFNGTCSMDFLSSFRDDEIGLSLSLLAMERWRELGRLETASGFLKSGFRVKIISMSISFPLVSPFSYHSTAAILFSVSIPVIAAGCTRPIRWKLKHHWQLLWNKSSSNHIVVSMLDYRYTLNISN